jgi:hypothetical protein
MSDQLSKELGEKYKHDYVLFISDIRPTNIDSMSSTIEERDDIVKENMEMQKRWYLLIKDIKGNLGSPLTPPYSKGERNTWLRQEREPHRASALGEAKVLSGEFVSIKSPDETILDMDYLLVDYFTEPSKIMVRVAKGEPSLQDHFINGTLVEKAVQLLKSNSLDITNKNLHEVITNQSIKDRSDPTLNLKSSIVEGKNKKVYLASAENTFVYIMIWKLLFPERSNDFSTLNILDGAGGYGSRLMAAIMLNSNYIGVEPNPLSTPGFNKMIKMLGSPQKQKMLEDGLPNAVGIHDLPLGWADVVMFSPPMWGKEVYNDETVEKQSINMFNDEQLWLTQFLYASIDVLWNHLRIGGFIVFQSVRYDYIGEYMIKKQDAVFKGIISRVTSTGRYKPNWIWQKI